MLTLYTARFSRSLMAEMVMAEGEVEFQRIAMDMRGGDHKLEAYRSVNPTGFIPALITEEGEVLYELPAINLWLCERYGIDLVPASDAPERGRFLSAWANVTGEVEPVMKRIFYPDRYHPDPGEAEAVKAMAWRALHERLVPIEARLAAGGPYFLGERFSLADLTLAYWMGYLEQRDDISPYPSIQRQLAGARERPALRAHFETLLDWIKTPPKPPS